MGLKREISKSNMLFLSIGSIVGSGWLFGSYYTAQIAGPAAILSWILGGFFITIIALPLAELGTMFPLAGGSVTFSIVSHGKMCGSIFSWITWLWSMVVAPIEVQAILQYASNYIPNVINTHSQTHSLTTTGFFLAAVLMIVLCAVNMVGVKLMANANRFIVLWKLAIPFLIALLLLTYRPHLSNLTAYGGFAPQGLIGVLNAISTGGVALSFFGFQTAIFLAGEAKNPQKSIPFSLFGSLLISTVLYVVLQLGFVLSVNPASLQNGWSKIIFDGAAGPFAGIFVSLGLVWAAKILYFDAILSPFGTAVGYVAASSRILYSMSLQDDAPRVLSKTNRFSIPWLAILVNFVLGMLFFLPFSGWQAMAAFISAAMVLSLVPGPVCLLVFRKKFPTHTRPFALPYASILCFAAFYLCSLLLHWTGWDTVKKLEIAVGIGIGIFLVSYFLNPQKNKEPLHVKSSLWLFLYLITAGVFSYLGEFGGGIGVLSMKVDFLLLFVSSVIIFIFAQKTMLEAEKYKELLDVSETQLNEKNDSSFYKTREAAS